MVGAEFPFHALVRLFGPPGSCRERVNFLRCARTLFWKWAMSKLSLNYRKTPALPATRKPRDDCPKFRQCRRKIRLQNATNRVSATAGFGPTLETFCSMNPIKNRFALGALARVLILCSLSFKGLLLPHSAAADDLLSSTRVEVGHMQSEGPVQIEFLSDGLFAVTPPDHVRIGLKGRFVDSESKKPGEYPSWIAVTAAQVQVIRSTLFIGDRKSVV